MIQQSNMICVLIANDYAIVWQGLAALLEQEPDLTVVAQANNGQEALTKFGQYQPDVTLMDVSMPQMDAVEAITALCNEFEAARIVAFTAYDGNEDIYRGLRAGAKSYLLKYTEPHELFLVICTVVSGKKYIPSPVGAKVADRMDKAAQLVLN